MSSQFNVSAPVELGADVAAFWHGLLRFPSKRPQKGLQRIRDVNGEEGWAGSDGDFHQAVAVSPGAFTWALQLRNLVELPALWFRLPLQGGEASDVWDAASALLNAKAVPLPHFVITDGDALTFVWRIDPLRRPRETAPEWHHQAFQNQLKYWRWAVIKLSFLFEELGAVPMDMARADELLLSLVPLPLPQESGLRRFASPLGLRAPELLVASTAPPIRIGDVSKPMKSLNARLFTALGRLKPVRKKVWRNTEVSQGARQPKTLGERHHAAVKLVCANRWDGLSPTESLEDLKAWASTFNRTGFPDKELADLVAWSEKRLSIGGPTLPSTPASSTSRRTSRDHVAAAVLGFLASEGGAWEGSVVELAQRTALWAIDRGLEQPVALRTLKRALADLVEFAELTHRVERIGRTWRSHWGLASSTTPDAPLALLSLSQGQEEKSMWVPDPPPGTDGVPPREGEGGDFPLLGGPGGAGPNTDVDAADENVGFQPAHLLAPEPEIRPESDLTELPGEAPAPGSTPPATEAERQEVELASASTPTPTTGAPAVGRQRRLPFPRGRARRQVRVPGEGLPPIDQAIRNALAEVGRELSGVDHVALIEEARCSLRPRPRVLEDFVGALRRRMLRILRLRSFAAASADHTAARTRAEERRQREAPRLVIDDRPPEVALADFRRLLEAQVKPLHERSVVERARRLHAEGLSLLPLQPRSKEPALSSWKAFQSERMTLARLERELEMLGADAGLAVVCGDVSEVVVVDFDDEDGVAWGRRHLPDTPWKTKTARGEHWYFRIHRGTWVAPSGPLPWKGELRAMGHYVVAPGSLHPEGQQYVAVGTWSAKATCPFWSNAWLEASNSADELEKLRAKRARILKSDA